MMAALQGQSQPYVIYQQLARDLRPQGHRFRRRPHPARSEDAAGRAPGRAFARAPQYAIDQFVMRGGKAIVLVDPLSEIVGAQQG